MRINEVDKKVIGFLESYPDYSPSPEQVSHMTASVKRELVRKKHSKFSSDDIAFALSFIPVILIWLAGVGIIQIPGGGITSLIPLCSALSHLHITIIAFAVAIPPLVLVILPQNARR